MFYGDDEVETLLQDAFCLVPEISKNLAKKYATQFLFLSVTHIYAHKMTSPDQQLLKTTAQQLQASNSSFFFMIERIMNEIY